MQHLRLFVAMYLQNSENCPAERFVQRARRRQMAAAAVVTGAGCKQRVAVRIRCRRVDIALQAECITAEQTNRGI